MLIADFEIKNSVMRADDQVWARGPVFGGSRLLMVNRQYGPYLMVSQDIISHTDAIVGQADTHKEATALFCKLISERNERIHG